MSTLMSRLDIVKLGLSQQQQKFRLIFGDQSRKKYKIKINFNLLDAFVAWSETAETSLTFIISLVSMPIFSFFAISIQPPSFVCYRINLYFYFMAFYSFSTHVSRTKNELTEHLWTISWAHSNETAKRASIWSFEVLLYETSSTKHPF